MGIIKILITDDNFLVAKNLFDKLSKFQDFQIVGIAKDGLETIELIKSKEPDVVLLDIIMPKLDGFGILEHFRNTPLEKNPVFIIFSAISKENYISRAMNLGAAYYIIKPFDENVIAERIRQLYGDEYAKPKYIASAGVVEAAKPDDTSKNSYDAELMLLATKYMREYGLKAHMTGYCYIRDIIMAAFDCYCQNGSLPKGIYRSIAVKNGVSIQKVERAIRNCIESVIYEKKIEKKPTNSQVICQLIEKIRIDN